MQQISRVSSQCISLAVVNLGTRCNTPDVTYLQRVKDGERVERVDDINGKFSGCHPWFLEVFQGALVLIFALVHLSVH